MKLCPYKQTLLTNIFSYNPPSEVNYEQRKRSIFRAVKIYRQSFPGKNKDYVTY